MKTNRNLKSRAKSILTPVLGVVIFLTFFMGECTQIRNIDIPEQVNASAAFPVSIVIENAPDSKGADGDVGIFGIYMPEGWSLEDTLMMTLIADTSGVTKDYKLGYSAAISDSILQDTLITVADGYVWRGYSTTESVLMNGLDSITIDFDVQTDANLGNKTVIFSIGDAGAPQRFPVEYFSATYNVEVIEASAIPSLSDESTVSVYPNPTSGLVTISTPKAGFSVNAYSIDGKLVMSQVSSQVETQLNLLGNKEGLYFIQISYNNEVVANKKVILNL